MCISLKFRSHQISALLPTGTDVTVTGNNVARRCGWKIYEHPAKSGKMANNEEGIVMYGAVNVPLRKRNVASEILITPHLNGLIIGTVIGLRTELQVEVRARHSVRVSQEFSSVKKPFY